MDRDTEEIDVNQDSPRVAVTMYDQDCQSYYSMGRYYAFTPVPNPPAIQINGMSAVFCCIYIPNTPSYVAGCAVQYSTPCVMTGVSVLIAVSISIRIRFGIAEDHPSHDEY